MTTSTEIFAKDQILTVAIAKQLIGKRIAITSAEYSGNSCRVAELTIGPVVNRWNYAANMPMDGYNNRQQYWAGYMSEERINEIKGELLLLDPIGPGIHAVAHTVGVGSGFYPVPTFTGSDADREVYYIEINQ